MLLMFMNRGTQCRYRMYRLSCVCGQFILSCFYVAFV